MSMKLRKQQNKRYRIKHIYFLYFVDIHDYERSDKFCMVCSKAGTNLETKLSFGCDEEPFGLCGTINIVSCNLYFSSFFHLFYHYSDKDKRCINKKKQSNLHLKTCTIFF